MATESDSIHIEINSQDVERTDELDQFTRDRIQQALKHFADQITRVEVHLHDENGPKGGTDKTCKLEGRPTGLEPLVVEQRSDNLHGAIREASGKLKRALRHELEKLGRLGHVPKR